MYYKFYYFLHKIGKIEISWARQLSESPNNRYSFVCSAILSICREVDNDRYVQVIMLRYSSTLCFLIYRYF